MMIGYVPKRIFFTKGVGVHREELHSFELALRDAGIEKCNLVKVSRIMPPGCKVVSRPNGLKELKPGAITFCVMSRCCSTEMRRCSHASVAVRAGEGRQGTSASTSFARRKNWPGICEDLAAAMLASTSELTQRRREWDEKKELFRISGKIVRTLNSTQSSIVKQSLHPPSAAAVFLF